MNTKNSIFVSLLLLSTLPLGAQGLDDNVHILDCVNTYEFKEGKNGKPEIANSLDIQYGVTKYGTLVQPGIFYGDFIRLDKASSKGTALYKSATPRNIFFDDTKICYFNYSIPKVGKTLRASFARTFIDPVYFTTIPLGEDSYVEKKTIQVVIPQAFCQYRLRECNLPANVTKEATVNEAGDSVFTYTIHHMPVVSASDDSPAWGYVAPYLLVTGSFKNVQDMFAWSKKLAAVECVIPNQADILAEIAKGANNDLEKIANTYAWVQRNIRYLAYEAGISAHQPATPAETIRKRYGDCKAMSLLLKTLLKAQGFDARQTDIGTDDIPYTAQEVPTIASINHAICTVFLDGKVYYLDATNPYIPLGYVPVNIQGCQALVEEGEGCRISTLPILPVDDCSSSIDYVCSLSAMDDGNLAMEGTLGSSWKGDMKSMVLGSYETASQDDRGQLLSRIMGMKNVHDKMGDVTMKGNRPQDETLVISASFHKDNVGLAVDGKAYIDMNPDADLFLEKVDTAKRKTDYMLGMRSKAVRTVRLSIPQNMRVQELPAPYEMHTDWVDMRRVFSRKGNLVVMRKEYVVKNRRIPLEKLAEWNKLVSDWNDACNEQIVVTN